jgi:hypothetical protein
MVIEGIVFSIDWRLNMLNIDPATTPSPSIPLPRGEREVKPLSLDGREVGERVFVKHSPYQIA